MLTEIFRSVLLMSAAGGILSIFLLCVKPVTRKLFSPKWQYYIWLTVLIVMILPVRFSLPQRTPDIAPAVQTQNAVVNTETVLTAPQTNTAVPQTLPEASQIPQITLPQNIMWYLSVIWCFGVIVVLLTKSAKYLIFLRALHKNSYADHTVLNIPKRLQVRRTGMLDAPLIVGLVNPVLYLPDTELSEGDLNYILMHELTHYRRHDLLYKWFTMLVLSVHWFNPLIHIVSKQIDLDCEVSCDAEVTGKLSKPEQDSYMNMILGLLSNSRSNLRPLTTQMASNKKTLKRRFEMIRNMKKTSKSMSVLSAILAVVMLGTTVFASGVLSGLTTDDYTIEITNNGEKIELVNKPFIENGEVYVPLRETIEKAGFEENNSHIVWDNGKIYITIAQNGTAGLFGIGIGEQYMNLKHIQASEIHSAYSTAFSDQQVIASFILKGIPILRNSNTYIPIKDINYMLYSFFNVRDEDNSLHELSCNVYDKNGNEIDASFGPISDMEADKIIADYENKQTKCYEITNKFLSALKNSDINAMKQYCTNKCKSYYFHDDEFYGMKSAVWHTVYSIRIFTDGRYYVHIGVKADDLDGGYGAFFLIFDEQEDGGFLISDIKNSYKDEWEFVDEKALDAQATIFNSGGEIVLKSNELKNPENTIEGFFNAFKDSNFAHMKNYCTKKCRSTFFGDGYCFGMSRAELTDISIDFRERIKSSNDFNVFVTVSMTPHEISVFDPSETATSFYVILQRQPDGRYLIDEFATGL